MNKVPVYLVLLALVAGGCAPESKGPPAPVAVVDVVQLDASPPTALSWDESPGPDGVQVLVRMYRVSEDKTETVTVSGTLEFLLFEGIVPPDALSRAQPFHTWTYEGPELRQFVIRNLGLWGYGLRLGWGGHVPRSDKVTLTARYTPPSGQPLYARPIIIMMTVG
jgi:hypothetical protein